MAAPLIFKLFTFGLLSIVILLPLYYFIGCGTLSIINGFWQLRFKESYPFKFEDVLVAALATLSLIIISCKLAGIFPQIQLVLYLAIAFSVVGIIIGFISTRKIKVSYLLALPDWSHSIIWLLLFGNYLVRAVVKARSLDESIYIPSSFNTDIFLYIRRNIVF